MKRKLGEILVAAGAVSESELARALADQPQGSPPARLGELLVAQGRITSQQLARALSVQHTVPYVDLPDIPPPVLDMVPASFQRQHRLVPFRTDGERLSIAMAEPGDKDAVKALRELLGPGRRVVVFVASGEEIDAVHASLGEEIELLEDGEEVPHAPPPRPEAKLEELFGDLDLAEAQAPAPPAPPADADLVLSAELVEPPLLPVSSPPSPPVGDAPELLPFDVGPPPEGAVDPVPDDAQQRAAAALDAFLGSSDTLLTRGEWTGRLDAVPDRRLLLALVRLLVERGIVREQDLLDMQEKP